MFTHSTRPGASGTRLFAVGTLLLLSLFACSASDPLEDALRMQAQGDYRGSIEPLRQLLDENPEDAQVNYLYGRALTASGQPSLGEWALRRAANDPEWLVPAGTQLAVSALNSGNFETAVEQTTRVLEAEPDNIEALLTRSQAYARSRRYSEEAIADADHILEIDPANTEAMEPRIQALLALERIDEASAAIEELGRMIDADPEADEWTRGWHCATTAIFASESDEKEKARELFGDCLERFPAHSNVVSSAIAFFDAEGEYARTMEILRSTVEAKPKSLDLRRRLAFRTRHTEGFEAAEKILLEGVEVADPPDVPTALQFLAKHYQDLGQHEEAVAAMRRALEASRALGASPPQLQFDYADALILSGDFDGALAVTEEMTLAPHRELIRARVAQERGDHLAALDHFEEGFRLWPDNPWARYLAARSAEATGQFDRAVELYRYAIRIQVGATDARYRLAMIHTHEGRPTEGLAILKIDAVNNPLSLDGELLALELSTWAGDQAAVATAVQHFSRLGPANYARALVAMGDGARKRYGAETAAQVIERYGATSLEAQDPARPIALIELIELLHEAGTSSRAEAPVRAAVAAHPEASGVHAALGRWFELSQNESEAEAAFERALALDGEDPIALAGMARIMRSRGERARALDYFDRAAAADPTRLDSRMAAAVVLVELDRREEATARLKSILEQFPHSALAARTLVRLQLDGDAVTDETRSYAERAVRFDGGVEALDLLARVYRRLNAPDRATEIEARARALRSAPPAEQPPPA